MDDSLTEKIRAVLSDPEAAAKIAQIASSLSGGGSSAPADEPQADAGAKPDPQTAESQTAGAFSSLPSFRGKACDPRIELLRALRPFVDGEKQRRLDDLLQIASVVSLLGTMKRH